MQIITTRPNIGDIINNYQVTEVRADGAVFGVEGIRLPKKQISALQKHFKSGAKGFIFRPGKQFAVIKPANTAKQNVMYALVNYKDKLLVAPDGNFYTGLPDAFAGMFCFFSADDALHAARKYIKPKFEVLPVALDANGFPSPVAV